MLITLQLVMSLSLLILLHELGHFLPARLFKIRVEKFYLFFDPWFSLIKKKVKDTEYGIGWLPLGGYVKISGMIDESMDKEQMAQPAQPWEFRSKPAWQRLIVMVGGVVMNIIVGIVIYAMILAIWGRDVMPVENAKYGVHVSQTMKNIGFQDGDVILKMNGETPESFQDVSKAFLVDEVHQATVNRNGQLVDIAIPADIAQQLVDANEFPPFSLRLPCVIDTIIPASNAANGGLLAGDSILGVADVNSIYFQDIRTALQNHKNETVEIRVARNGQHIPLQVAVSDQGTIGFNPASDMEQFGVKTIHYSVFAAIPAGARIAWETVADYVSNLKYIFSKKGATQVGGFASFAKLFPEKWDWARFWERTALISLILAFMNILPVPALDGGHVIFLIWEMITGKAVSQKILERAQLVGMVLILGLLLWGNGLDIYRAIAGK